MKKIWIILSLVVISLFVAACGTSTGEATRFKGFGGSTQKVPTRNQDVMKEKTYVPLSQFNELKERVDAMESNYIPSPQFFELNKKFLELDDSLKSTWGAINTNQQDWNCVDACRRSTPDETGKCLAGYGFDGDEDIMKDIVSCNVQLKNLGSSGPHLACLCR